MKTKVAVLVASFAVLLFTVVGGLVGVRASSNDGAYRQLQVYSEVLSRVRSEYVEDPKIPTVTEGALHASLGGRLRKGFERGSRFAREGCNGHCQARQHPGAPA